jgi:hypothetical protein
VHLGASNTRTLFSVKHFAQHVPSAARAEASVCFHTEQT